MHFGKAEHKQVVDYTLAPDHKSIAKVLGGLKAATPEVYTGGVLWADERFKGVIYPAKAKAGDYVKHYTKQFNTIELNSTHYRVPGPETFTRWREIAPQGFKFCPKIHQSISHADDLRKMIGFHNECNALFELLQEKLGTCFMQVSPQFSPQRLNELTESLDNSELTRLALELRHEDWFSQPEAFNALCNFLYRNGMGLVITDTAGRRDVVHMRLTNKTAFIRFKACEDPQLDQHRITNWVLRAKSWFDLGLEKFYFFVHTADKSQMPYLVTYFVEQMAKICSIHVKAPEIISNAGGETLF